MTDSKVKCVAVIQPRGDESMDYCIKAFLNEEWFYLCQLPQVKEAGLNCCKSQEPLGQDTITCVFFLVKI